MCSYGGYQGIFNATSSVIPWQAAYGTQINESLCPNEKAMGGTK